MNAGKGGSQVGSSGLRAPSGQSYGAGRFLTGLPRMNWGNQQAYTPVNTVQAPPTGPLTQGSIYQGLIAAALESQEQARKTREAALSAQVAQENLGRSMEGPPGSGGGAGDGDGGGGGGGGK